MLEVRNALKLNGTQSNVFGRELANQLFGTIAKVLYSTEQYLHIQLPNITEQYRPIQFPISGPNSDRDHRTCYVGSPYSVSWQEGIGI